MRLFTADGERWPDKIIFPPETDIGYAMLWANANYNQQPALYIRPFSDESPGNIGAFCKRNCKTLVQSCISLIVASTPLIL